MNMLNTLRQHIIPQGFMRSWMINNMLAWTIALFISMWLYDAILFLTHPLDVAFGGHIRIVMSEPLKIAMDISTTLLIFFIIGQLQKQVFKRWFQWDSIRWISALVISGLVISINNYLIAYTTPIVIFILILLPTWIALRKVTRQAWVWFLGNALSVCFNALCFLMDNR